jgi:hypothetical protein
VYRPTVVSDGSTPPVTEPRQARAAQRSWRRMLTASEAVAQFGTPSALAVARWFRREAQDTKRALDGYIARGGKIDR